MEADFREDSHGQAMPKVREPKNSRKADENFARTSQ
jgi:hypothetical protein